MRMIALLRAINVGGNRKVPMEQLRALASKAGLQNVQTYIQSGNVVFDAALAPSAVEALLERALEKQFGFEVPVIVRSARAWATYAKGSPFADAEVEHPNLLHLLLSKSKPNQDALAALRARAAPGERLELLGDALWVYFSAGLARTKLTPAAFDKAVGSSVTARNFKTVKQLAAIAT